MTLNRIWLYQDFPAGTASPITLTANDNGTGLVFSAAAVVNNSAVVTKLTGLPIYNDAANEIPANLVTASNPAGATVLLSSTPDAAEGGVRVWYLYVLSLGNLPLDLVVAPDFVTQTRINFLDTTYLNANLNLSDIGSAVSGRTNLGFANQTAGQVLYGTGSNDFTSSASLFWDTVNSRLGINSPAVTPSAVLDVHSNGNAVATLQANNIGAQSVSGGGLVQVLADPAAAILSGNRLGAYQFAGATDASSTFYTGAAIQALTTENWSGTAGGTKIQFLTTPNTTHTRTLALTIDQDQSATFTGAVTTGALSAPSLTLTVTPLAITSGGTGQTTAAAAFNALSPMTTLGDIIYEDAIPVGARLAGNITTTKMYLSQTGTGAISAAPAWAQIAFADLSGQTTLAQLPTIADATILSNISGGAAVPAANSLTAIIDYDISSTEGVILYRGAAVWSALAAGTVGQYLGTGGAGADPSWSRPLGQKAGLIALAIGTFSKAITFATARANALYTPKVTLVNTVDSTPSIHPILVFAIATTGFSFEWPEQLDTANYVAYWAIEDHYDP